jgi:uncharacterized membrane protein HdeD (DUF308 family)
MFLTIVGAILFCFIGIPIIILLISRKEFWILLGSIILLIIVGIAVFFAIRSHNETLYKILFFCGIVGIIGLIQGIMERVKKTEA